MVVHKSEVINKLFFRELQQIIEKYNLMDVKTIQIIESIYLDMKDIKLRESLLSDNDKIEEVINYYKDNEIDIDEITFYIWYNMYIEEVSIDTCNVYYTYLCDDGYVEVDQYLIYSNSGVLSNYTKDRLEDMLESSYEIDRLFDKDQIIDFWIEGTSKDELIYDIIESIEMEEILDITTDYCFTFSDDTEYVYANKNE